MKKIMLAVMALVISLGINSQTPTQNTGREHGKRCQLENASANSPVLKATMRVNKIAEAVEITDNERVQLTELFVNHFNEINNNAEVDKQAMRTKLRNGIVEIIGQEKYDKYREYQQANNQKKGQGHSHKYMKMK